MEGVLWKKYIFFSTEVFLLGGGSYELRVDLALTLHHTLFLIMNYELRVDLALTLHLTLF
jgi:hypothetical protein